VRLRDAAPRKIQERTGKGTVDFAWILDALAERGYSGDFSIEYLTDLEGGPEASILEPAAMLHERTE
jgi:sugar phosphate isomerase/epimerase